MYNMQNRYQNYDGQIIDLKTGEIVDLKQIKQVIEMSLYDKYIESAQTLIELNQDVNFRLVTAKNGESYSCVNVKEGYHFVKVFKVDVRRMLETFDISLSTRGFIYTCLAYLHFPTNSIVIDGECPSIEKLCSICKIGKSKLYEILKELEQYEIIKRKKVNGQMVIYMNPFLHSTGLVHEDTYKMFKDSGYNPYK
jgi:hypothetical protein